MAERDEDRLRRLEDVGGGRHVESVGECHQLVGDEFDVFGVDPRDEVVVVPVAVDVLGDQLRFPTPLVPCSASTATDEPQ